MSKKNFTLIDTVNLPVIKSSGGLVYNKNHHLLLIFKRGSWDLPKGRVENKENIELNALREVEEETGLSASKLKIEGRLPSTWHTTSHGLNYYLKKTQWYIMQYSGSEEDAFCPQVEEGIIECRWVHLSKLKYYEDNIRRRVQYVIDFWLDSLVYALRP